MAIGLNGGNLQLNTNGRVVQATGTIDSGNAYKIYTMGTPEWTALVTKIKSQYSDDVWWQMVSDYYNSLSRERRSQQRSNIEAYFVANHWDFAKVLAQDGTNGTTNVGDKYLATITTSLENSLVSQGKENPLFVGGQGSGNSTRPANATYTDGYYWVTGPEGTRVSVDSATGRPVQGTKFADNTGKQLENFYANWNSSASGLNNGSQEQEPNNSGPYVTVGYGSASKWDDVKESASTTRGFVQETNLAHSGLVINSSGGNVDLKGNVGHSVALTDFTIKNAGNVNIGGGTSASGSTFSGIVNVDSSLQLLSRLLIAPSQCLQGLEQCA